MLFPRESEARDVKDLSGLWNFRADTENRGYEERWYETPLEHAVRMPVPASYNDIVQDAGIRTHIGDVWYDRSFFIPQTMKGQRLVLRVGSATHHATVWLNGTKVAQHKGGFLPFEADITDIGCLGAENRVTICVNNELDWSCLPPGEVITYNDDKHPEGYRVQSYRHDCYNFSGINRPVRLYTTPETYISDIRVATEVDGTTGLVSYSVELCERKASDGTEVPAKAAPSRDIRVRLVGEDGKEAAAGSGGNGRLVVSDARLWEPGNAYLYTLEARTLTEQGELEDCYRLPIGIRTVKVTDTEFLINDKPFYFKGFGYSEDSDIRGMGMDEVLNVKDINLHKWIGSNCFRTSVHPYSEEMMNLADREGLVVIDEVPAVGMHFFDVTETVICEEREND